MDKTMVFRILGLSLFLFAIAAVLIPSAKITGAAVSDTDSYDASQNSRNNLSYVVGSAILIISFALFAASGLEKKVKDDYFHKRAAEIAAKAAKYEKNYIEYSRKNKQGSEEKYSTEKGIWISQWELPYIKKEFEKLGLLDEEKDSHFGGETGPSQKHIKISGRIKGEKVRHHIFITPDPYDPRLHYSRIYNPERER